MMLTASRGKGELIGSHILCQAANGRASCGPLMQKKNVLWCLEQEAESCLEAEAGGWQAKGQDRQLSETLIKKKRKKRVGDMDQH